MNRLFIQIYGSGRPLVLFHGWGFDSSIWHTICPDILSASNAYQLFLVDLPGFGSSPLMSWSDFKQQLFMALPSQFSVLAWSLGGLFATRLAKEAPTKIKNILLVGSTPYFMQSPNWIGILPETLTQFYQAFVTAPHMTRQQFIRAQLPTDMNWDESADSILYPDSIIGLHQGLLILKYWDLRTYLGQLTMPVAYLFGRLDKIVPYKTALTMQQLYPQFDYSVLPRAGHMPFLSHRSEFIHWLMEQG